MSTTWIAAAQPLVLDVEDGTCRASDNRGVYHHIVTALGGKPSFHTAALIPQARNALAAKASERGRTPILLLDEAHILDHNGLDAIRLLTLCRDGDYAEASGSQRMDRCGSKGDPLTCSA